MYSNLKLISGVINYTQCVPYFRFSLTSKNDVVELMQFELLLCHHIEHFSLKPKHSKLRVEIEFDSLTKYDSHDSQQSANRSS